MTALENAAKIVAQLSPEELAQFRQWFAEFDGDAWDAQIEANAAAGKLDSLAQEALVEYHTEVLAARRLDSAECIEAVEQALADMEEGRNLIPFEEVFRQ